MPTVGVFVYKFIQQLVKAGHSVTVISSYQLVPRRVRWPRHYYGEELATVYRPIHLSFSTKWIGRFNTYEISKRMQIRSIRRIVKNKNIEFDVVYCHFIKNALLGVAALNKFNKPVFAAVGENKNIDVVQKWYNKKKYFDLFKQIAGFVAVSPMVADKLKKMGVHEDKIITAPNGTDISTYKPGNKIDLRGKNKLPTDKFIVAFIGRLTHDKGPLRVLKAIEELDDVGAIFMGEGEQNPEGNQVLFKGKVPGFEVPDLLACADVFVLPTLHEGSNNAIVEAMACGLPIISSDIPEIRVQCDSGHAILVDPMCIDSISDAILKLKGHPDLCKRMSVKSREKAAKFDIAKRAENVIAFINQLSKTQNQ